MPWTWTVRTRPLPTATTPGWIAPAPRALPATRAFSHVIPAFARTLWVPTPGLHTTFVRCRFFTFPDNSLDARLHLPLTFCPAQATYLRVSATLPHATAHTAAYRRVVRVTFIRTGPFWLFYYLMDCCLFLTTTCLRFSRTLRTPHITNATTSVSDTTLPLRTQPTMVPLHHATLIHTGRMVPACSTNDYPTLRSGWRLYYSTARHTHRTTGLDSPHTPHRRTFVVYRLLRWTPTGWWTGRTTDGRLPSTPRRRDVLFTGQAYRCSVEQLLRLDYM